MASRWDVVEVDLGDPQGHEQGWRRPALVVSNDRFNARTGLVCVCPITSTPRRLYRCEVQLPAGSGGLPKASIVMAHQVRTLDAGRLCGLFGQLVDPVRQREVREALIEFLELDQ